MPLVSPPLQTIELWTRRNFRCDCGNQKFGQDAKCQLYPNKDPVNDRNQYNQNYTGVYCTCHKPYPDPNREDEYDMDMCVACEDWFHGEHLGLPDNLQVRPCSSCPDTLIGPLSDTVAQCASRENSLFQLRERTGHWCALGEPRGVSLACVPGRKEGGRGGEDAGG